MESLKNKKILFIGCGKMGGAIVKNLLKNNFEYPQFTILKPSKNNLIAGIKYISSYEDLPKNYKADIIFLAFKPQFAKKILKEFSNYKINHSKSIFISILAGKKSSFFLEILDKKSKLIRLMPNLPTLINQGIFAYFCNKNIQEEEIKSIELFLNFIGKNIRVDKEKLIDSVTAISGSGPAYLFLFIKSLISAAVNLGLAKQDAEKLVEETIYGSAKMALLSSEDLEYLIKSVASKGGTTEAALEVLQKDNQFQNIIFDATEAAFKRSKELAK